MNKSGKTLWQKEKLLVLSNFFFCHYVFIKLSAAEASECVYMRKRVNGFAQETISILISPLLINLTLLSHLQTHFDASATDYF